MVIQDGGRELIKLGEGCRLPSERLPGYRCGFDARTEAEVMH